MNEVDLLIILVVGLNVYHGATKGVVRGVGDFAGLFLALGLGSVAYVVPAAVFGWFGFPPLLRDLLGFLLAAIGIAVGMGYLSGHIAERRPMKPTVDRIGGGAAGAVIGVILVGVLLLASAAVTGTTQAVDRAAIAQPFVQVVPTMHLTMDRIGLPIPKLVMLPPKYEQELAPMRYGPQFMRLNFARLDGATCIKCRGRMKFLGYKLVKGSRIAPKFQCAQCGRTTDGCQSFQGMHAIYNQCPVVVARQGIRLNCGVWTNKDFVYPKGPCPIDGNVFTGVTAPGADNEEPNVDLPGAAGSR